MADEKVSENFSSFIQKNMKIMAEGIKSSGVLPVGSTRNNFNACYPSFTSKMKPYSDEVLNTISTVLTKEGIKQSIKNCDNEDRIDLVVDGVNRILDRVRDNLNIMKGSKITSLPSELPAPKENTGMGSWNKNLNRSIIWKANQVENIKKPVPMQKIIEKPQLKFENKIDNSNSPFEPSLQFKHNAVKPLAIYLERDLEGTERYCHPYMHELNLFEVPQHTLEKVEPVPPVNIDSFSLLYVDNEELLAMMIEELRGVTELALDLEHHQYRSFQGFTCLMQISTRIKDYIIDTIALRSKLHVLNEFFTNPKIVKVLHGASSDVVWLQKDLNLYLINMFDTHEASTVLKFPKLSLAYLLKHYCNVDTDKRYQLYDWRTRPLPEAAISYARGDTHYLLFIYDHLRNELIDRQETSGSDNNLMRTVYSRGIEICKNRYEKTFDVNGHLSLYKHSKQSFDGRQMYALKLLYQWRDIIARERDESTGYVLPNHMLLQIAEILPREMQGILACCNPVPPLVRHNLTHLHQLIAMARSQPINKIADRQDVESITANKRQSLSRLKCPHDFSHHDDFRDNLATLLNGNDRINLRGEQCKLKLSVFDYEETSSKIEGESIEQKVNFKSLHFISPYERYKRTVEFEQAQAEKRKAIEKTEIEQQTLIPTELEENVHIFSVKSKHGEKSECKNEPEEIPDPTSVNKIKQEPSNEMDEKAKGSSKRKKNSLADKMPARKCVKYDDVVFEPVLEVSQNVEQDFCVVDEIDEPIKETVSSNLQGDKRRRNQNKKRTNNNRTNPSTAVGSSLEPFDYTQVNYDKFSSAGQTKVKPLLNSKIKFGTNKKNKNQKQKRFQRQRKK